MLDEVGLIHMNGRLFDPAIGRFTQADPIIQEPLNSQNYNRYSYVLNNPLVYTDPSGYSFWTKVRQPLAAVAVMVATYGTGSHLAAASYEATAIATDAAVTSGAVTAEAGSVAMAAASTTAGNITAAFTIAGGFAGGGISGGNIESAVLGAIQATASMGIGDATYHGSAPPSAALYAQNVLAHAALGCGMSAAQGGSCKSGALAGGFSAAAGPVISGLTEGNFAAGLAGRMAAGCVGSYIGKGSCEAGAVTAAFDYLYNDLKAYVWQPRPSEGSVGHVMITDDENRVLESQFPKPHGLMGKNTTLTFAETVAAEGRPADAIFRIATSPIQDSVASNVAAIERSKASWAFVTPRSDQTNCSVSADNILGAVNTPYKSSMSLIIPSPWTVYQSLDALSRSIDSGIRRIR